MDEVKDYKAAFQLHGKVALVTGAGGNLGAEYVERWCLRALQYSLPISMIKVQKR